MTVLEQIRVAIEGVRPAMVRERELFDTGGWVTHVGFLLALEQIDKAIEASQAPVPECSDLNEGETK